MHGLLVQSLFEEEGERSRRSTEGEVRFDFLFEEGDYFTKNLSEFVSSPLGEAPCSSSFLNGIRTPILGNSTSSIISTTVVEYTGDPPSSSVDGVGDGDEEGEKEGDEDQHGGEREREREEGEKDGDEDEHGGEREREEGEKDEDEDEHGGEREREEGEKDGEESGYGGASEGEREEEAAAEGEIPRSVKALARVRGKGKGTFEPVLCKICCDTVTSPDELYTLTCGHMYCRACLSSSLTVLISQASIVNICPQPGCGALFTTEDISKLCTPEISSKYAHFVEQAALRADPNVRWCPLPTCSAAVKGPPTDPLDYLVCGSCGMNICFKCGDERHEPVKCGEEAQQLLASRHARIIEAQIAFETWKMNKKDEVKKCPGCRGFIEKNRGCNHMTCKSCKFQFCWICLTKYEAGHFADPVKFPDCNGKQYWSPPTPPDPELQKKFNWIYFPPNYQYSNIDRIASAERIKTRRKRTATKVCTYVGVGVGVAVLGVPAAVVGAPIYGIIRLRKYIKSKRVHNA